MRIIWNGHACFTLESGDYRIVFDPYTLEAYPPLSVEADEALCSHGHRDHSHTAAVTFRAGGKSPFTVRKLATFHDGEKGALRGENTVHIVDGEGLRIVHCGDLGHLLSEEQLAAIGKVDLLLIPVGGYYTIDAKEAKATVDAIAPRIVVPMHYRHGEFGLRPVGEVEDFLALCDAGSIHRLDTNEFILTAETDGGVIVPKFIP